MRKIAATEYYELSVDPLKNRAYLVLRKFWRKPEEYKNYPDDWRKACRLLRKGFTVCVDSTDWAVMTPEVQPLHEAAQNIVMEMGMSALAEVIPQSSIMNVQIDMLSQKTGMPKRKFGSVEDAERWLDEYTTQ